MKCDVLVNGSNRFELVPSNDYDLSKVNGSRRVGSLNYLKEKLFLSGIDEETKRVRIANINPYFNTNGGIESVEDVVSGDIYSAGEELYFVRAKEVEKFKEENPDYTKLGSIEGIEKHLLAERNINLREIASRTSFSTDLYHGDPWYKSRNNGRIERPPHFNLNTE
ncbi:hypothetical protein GOV05_04485 [Candidatus Woesearchaeota archaeon]|nr:hypothetical protein [Candidatus Woesearchaeota archaeon]